MRKDVILWSVIGVLFVVALFLVFQAGSANYETVQASGVAAKSASASYGGMVGGC